MEEFKFIPNVNLEEKEVLKKELEILTKKLELLKDFLNGVRDNYNEYEANFPDDKKFLEDSKAFGLKVTKEIERINIEIVKKVASVSTNYGGAN
ncbi:TPA: hypothetical protein DEP30_02855 [Candidatus Nomurabacteria bacterium]|nr:MAG: hypothetical protein UR97_C0004G0076 [Candidatus Nomurabacteria bacterium GW2011_GWE2_36_115]KKP94207.1 MAG: hypothetical protein US00_C0003G0131 [Candidatus Nomurabacteria bacterium GW2011_GWF2_36_126]KKP96665.1 MAG: hypothetical protein US04_C0001G0167 [Candidatus Nomurabacteria bacterium GW2011_GWD2_36_14]KKP99731.1 MAG: hypothetical protein US08_C0001G0414 [Candidatus Nomurabacteria bacterium GW2011_GWF2_36_19]KKQ05323.1 MAG: hypothetical protein US17_C0005G0090 [Candidatus Nomuraba